MRRRRKFRSYGRRSIRRKFVSRKRGKRYGSGYKLSRGGIRL